MKKRFEDLRAAVVVSGMVFLLLYPFIAFAEWEWSITHWHWWSRLIIAVACCLVFLYLFASDSE
jgi:hypothetical protein